MYLYIVYYILIAFQAAIDDENNERNLFGRAQSLLT